MTHQPAPRQPLTSKPSRNRVLIRSTKSSITDTTDYSSIYNLEEECDISSNLVDDNCSNNGVEIWLDLRGTSLSPSTALELWEIEQQQDGATAVPFTKCLVSSPSDSSSNNNNSNSPQKSNNNRMNVLVAAGNDQIVMESSQTSSSWGKILPLETSSQSIPMLPDPLPAMDIISQGKWIILDTTRGWKKVEEEERLSFLLPLAELISSGAIPSTGGEGGGGGGIGLTCHTKNEVVKVAMWIRSITNNRSSTGQKSVRTKTLDSGLVIPDNDDFDASSASDELKLGRRNDSQGGLQYAIVVPYDVGLLKTASMLLSNE